MYKYKILIYQFDNRAARKIIMCFDEDDFIIILDILLKINASFHIYEVDINIGRHEYTVTYDAQLGEYEVEDINFNAYVRKFL